MPYDRDRCWQCGGVSHALIETYVATRPVCRSCEGPTLTPYQDTGVTVQGVRRLSDPAHRGLTPRRKGFF
jgi:hypothetical protein